MVTMCVSTRVRVCVCVFIHTNILTYIHIYVCIYVYVFIHIHIYIYIYIYIYMISVYAIYCNFLQYIISVYLSFSLSLSSLLFLNLHRFNDVYRLLPIILFPFSLSSEVQSQNKAQNLSSASYMLIFRTFLSFSRLF